MRSLVAAAAAVIVGSILAVPATAGASVQVSETAVSSSTRTYRALLIVDQLGEANVLRLGAVTPSGPDPLAPPSHFDIVDLGVGVANIPDGCRVSTDSGRRLECPFADYDTIIIDAGGGDDDVSSSIRLPALKPKRIFSPNHAVPLNVFLGDGTDAFSGTDYRPSTDAVFGQGGRDKISGGDSSDLLDGGPGKDDLDGRGGINFLFGGAGSDSLGGGLGQMSFMIGGRGRDVCHVGTRKDRVNGCERYTF